MMNSMHYNAKSNPKGLNIDLNEELEYMYALERFGVKPGLAVMEQMMNALGHPEKQFKSIHVTGTNGKGSTCAMMESVLREAGYKTALYTSPHLYAFNERIQIHRVPISDEALVLLVKEIREACEKETIQPTFFEFTTALAFLYFARSNIDIAVIEVGMGGRYDATNVITPILSVITNVGLDHTDYLGPTTAHIAREKAGIIKEGVPVVTAETDSDILDIFDEEAKEKHTTVSRVQDVVHAEVISAGLDGQEVDVQLRTPSRLPTGQAGSPLSKGEKLRDEISSPHMRGGEVGSYRVHLPLLGAHQVTNMQTAIAAVLALNAPHPCPPCWRASPLPERERGTLARGIASTIWEGRLQIIAQDPLIIVDGAHNPDGALALADFLQQIPSYDVLVFAAKKGKDISDMMESVIPLFSHVIITEGSFMPEKAEIIAEKIRSLHSSVVVEKDIPSAFDLAKTLAHKNGTIVVTGSLYMIADVLAYVKTL